MITNNFDKNLFLSGQDAVLELEEGTISFSLPTLGDLLKMDFNIFATVIGGDLTEVNERMPFKVKTRLELALSVLKVVDTAAMGLNLLKWLNKYFKNVEYVDDCLLANDIVLTEQIFDYFCLCCAVACGYKEYRVAKKELEEQMSTATKTPEELEFERRQKEAEERVRRLKEKNKERKDSKDQIAKQVLFIAAEFQYKLEEVYGMTHYAVGELYRLCYKKASDRIQVVAFGSGLTKKNAEYKYLEV